MFSPEYEQVLAELAQAEAEKEKREASEVKPKRKKENWLPTYRRL